MGFHPTPSCLHLPVVSKPPSYLLLIGNGLRINIDGADLAPIICRCFDWYSLILVWPALALFGLVIQLASILGKLGLLHYTRPLSQFNRWIRSASRSIFWLNANCIYQDPFLLHTDIGFCHTTSSGFLVVVIPRSKAFDGKKMLPILEVGPILQIYKT